MTDMERVLEQQTLEGEIGLVIDYSPGRTLAVDVLQAAMGMIEALDSLDAALLSSVDTTLEPVSVLNDVQHSSLKMLLQRALRKIPDEHLNSLDWKKWVGALLVKGKHKLLSKLDADGPEIATVIRELESDYKAAPGGLIGYNPPRISDVREAMDNVIKARASLPGQKVTIQTEFGDVVIPDNTSDELTQEQAAGPQQHIVNRGLEFFRVKAPDMIGESQWVVLRNNRSVRVDMLHRSWLDAYHARKFSILPGDSLKCQFEETITYDAMGTELARSLAIIEVVEVISPPSQQSLLA